MTQILTLEKPHTHTDCIFCLSVFSCAQTYTNTHTSYWSLRVSLFLFFLLLEPHSVSVFALSTVAVSVSVANLQAYFRTIFLHRLQSPLSLLITVKLGWHVHEDKAVFLPLQPQCQSCSIENVFTVVSTNEFWRRWVSLANWRSDYIHFRFFFFFWYAPYFAFVLSGTWHLYWQHLKGNDKLNQNLHTLFPWCQTARCRM